MAKKLSSVLGIDIGSQSIKICELRTQGREPVVTALGIVPTPEGSVDHSGIINPEPIASAIKAALNQSGAAVKNAVISITGQQSVLVRTLEVPRMDDKELKDHMQWEINRNIPFAESTIVSDFKPLGGEDPSSPNMEVVMAISPQSAIDTTVTCVKKAGRVISAIDVEPLSMARSLGKSYDDVFGDKTVCLVDIGHLSTSINIYYGSRLVMPRQVPLGGEMLTSAISTALTVPLDEAETLKRERASIPESAGVSNGFDGMFDPTQGFSPFNPFSDDVAAYNPVSEPTGAYAPVDDSPYGGAAINPVTGEPMGDFATTTDPYAPAVDPYAPVADPYAVSAPTIPPTSVDTPVVSDVDPETQRLYDAMAPLLNDLVSEIRRSIDYFVSRGGVIDAVEVCGGGAKLKGLPEFLSRSLGVTCDAYDPLRRLNLNVRKVAPGFVDEHRQEFAVAIGNGLHIFFE